jgi:TolB protein
VNIAGTELVPVTTATAQYVDSSNPQWSPGGTQIIFQSRRALDATDAAHPSLTFNIWRVNANGSGLIALTKANVGDHGYNPRWSPDGTKIVFESTRMPTGLDALGQASNIWRVNADGSELIPITKATAWMADSNNPQWSPDGTKIVFQSRRDLELTDALADNFTFNIWRVNFDGSELTPITRVSVQVAHSYNPQWSPDGSKIVFQSARSLDGTDAAHPNLTVNIWRVNADGLGLIPITLVNAARTDSEEPQWSPDARQIAFHSKRKLDGSDGLGVTSNIWRVNADGSGLTRLTTITVLGADCYSPQWSPDGNKIVFRSRRKLDGSDAFGPTFNLWSVNATDGSGLMPLTKTTALGTDSYNPQFKR